MTLINQRVAYFNRRIVPASEVWNYDFLGAQAATVR